MGFAEIIVNTPLGPGPVAWRETPDAPAPSSRERAFTYSVPERLAASIALGQLVWVPFGTRRLQGVVVAFSDTSPVDATKDIEEIVDRRPFLSPAQIDLARWISETYLCSFMDAIHLMLPTGIEQQAQVMVALTGAEAQDLTPHQAALVDLLEKEEELAVSTLPQELRGSVEPLVRRGILVKRTRVSAPRARPKQVKSVRLLSETPPAESLSRNRRTAERYAAIVDFLREEKGSVWISAVYAATGCSRSDLQKLRAAGVIALDEEQVWRDSLAERTFDIVEPPTLTPEQQAAWDRLLRHLKAQAPATGEPKSWTPAAFLLHGVTGSGKTEIYLLALDEMLRQGRQGIVLVPEISLTPQTIRRFGARFPNRIAVLHSKLPLGERYDTWRRCRDGQVDIIIGSRSALFAPLPRLGLIVLDEEHEPAYKQEAVPHYHAREVALEWGRRVGATVILGSATPDLETYYRATKGEITLLEMPRRIMGHRGVIESEIAQLDIGSPRLAVHELSPDYREARYLDLPPVEIVDLRAELKAGNRSIFSRALQREMARTLAAREQIILFLNRRGSATFVLCRDCGNVFRCRRCDNPMTYHAGDAALSSGDVLVCHHCNRRDRMPSRCPNCQSGRIRYFGTGTQKVEDEIGKLFPQAQKIRWDFDVTRGKESHEAILDNFARHQADILIGTQMIAKSLDLPLVTLVGVISADTSLNLPDFRAGERTFQLLTQVAGRAGRSILGGKVILQTYAPEHYAVQAASHHDYAAFYAREIAFRREQGYPPFNRLIRLLYTNASEKRAREEAARMSQVLTARVAQKGLPALDLIGPAPAFFHRVRGAYRYHLIVRGPDPHALLQDIALPLGWRVDVDPVSVL